ncbi:SPOR domain-containing protein [Reinekea thalattae]|uniref:SPOR domain-containing protein n=1 Tax=Reinekea thalattae TaxID=2593301 RepID=A0A5C8Z7S7_9GAMM|nr:SPOR domain-containing protein [Reinekea thalattae]TXR53697.1 hypothetical protein FME95_03820 [Reinekea thalattae]
MDAKLSQRLVGLAILLLSVLILAPMIFDAEGRVPEGASQPKDTAIELPVSSLLATQEQNQAEQQSEPVAQPEASVSAVVSTAQSVVQSGSAQAQLNTANDSSTTVDGLWSVQVASFRDRSKASALQQTLQQAGLNAYFREKLLSDESLFTQVFVGPVDSKAAAEQLKEQIKTQFKQQGLVVRYRQD